MSVRRVSIAIVLATVSPTLAFAQQPVRAVFSANFATTSTKLGKVSQSFPLLDETATVESTFYGVIPAMGLDLGLAARVAGRFGIGGSYTLMKGTSDGQFKVTLPHPAYFNRPATDRLAIPELIRKQTMVHLSGVVFLSSGSTVATLSAGPTYFNVTQEMAVDSDVRHLFSGDVYYIELSNAEIESVRGTGWGWHVGFDWGYFTRSGFGFGLQSRVVKMTVPQLPTQGTLGATDLGGTITGAEQNVIYWQASAGLRLRF